MAEKIKVRLFEGGRTVTLKVRHLKAEKEWKEEQFMKLPRDLRRSLERKAAINSYPIINT